MKIKTPTSWLALAVFVLLLAGCQPATQPGGEEAGTPGAAGARTGEAKRGEQKISVAIPAGTALEIRLTDAIDTGTTQVGNTFEGSLAAPLIVNGTEVAPLGSSVMGKVTHAVSSGRLNRPAEISLTLTSLTVAGGQKVEIATNSWSMKGESHKKRNIGMIGGGAGAGAVIGAIAGGKKGAAIGGAVGAGAGTGVAAATGKKEIQLAPETKLSFQLSSPVTITVAK
jgi:hypothetical protein